MWNTIRSDQAEERALCMLSHASERADNSEVHCSLMEMPVNLCDITVPAGKKILSLTQDCMIFWAVGGIRKACIAK